MNRRDIVAGEHAVDLESRADAHVIGLHPGAGPLAETPVSARCSGRRSH